ncbi:virulence factor SrfB [Oceanisphaera sp. W20_SRM_FM3]|uniref:virulence factor SrfB n=1 Tax=Oceanisphaera sp. W20_SRM_FM3 TaxID=3240267 RepID=UPI003F9CFA80
MLAEITEFEETVSLVSDTGIQFMDFALKFDERKAPAGEFVFISSEKTLLTRLLRNEEKDFQFYQLNSGAIQKAKPEFDVSMKDSLALLDGIWVPCPIFRFKPPHHFDQGPGNWSRMRLVKLEKADIDGNTHRLTLAFDTRIMPHIETNYLAPNAEDVGTGISFRMACHTWEMSWFLDQEWVAAWLREIFIEANAHRLREDIESELKELHYQAHYLNLLSLFSRPLPEQQTQEKPKAEIPDICIVANEADGLMKPIAVDLVLDVGNSRTCGILIEDHGQAGSGMRQNYVLQLRDLLTPEQVYQDPFESRIEFAQASFGKDHHSVKSGRHGAFQWPTIARVGKEAGRLASFRRGTEGSTGLSSPKRYLWDEQAYGHGWRFNSSYVKTDSEPYATAAPFSLIINDTGEALYAIEDEDERMPVFTPLYSRSSLMTFMLAEVLTQALCQINSPAQRSRQGHARTPRQLNSIILTVPPGMPLAERSILNERLQQAIGLVWKSMGWHTASDENPWAEGSKLRIPMPKVRVEWDEASCGQLVYLYNEINRNFAGHPEALFATLARPDKTDRERITLATIDIGGGTTDLVITDYSLDRNGSGSVGSNAYIKPEQRFRDGFKIAGDDIVLDVIQHYVLPSFAHALKAAGVSAADALMSRLCGGESLDARDQVLRQQLNLQVFTPLALAILKEYEQYDPEQDTVLFQHSYLELLGDKAVSEGVLEYVNSAIRREAGPNTEFNLLGITLSLSLQQLHQDFLADKFNITKTLAALCEVVTFYPCDMLLLTGRPSRLPGVQAYIRQLLPVPTDRILPLQGYRTGGWYPFHKNGLIDDPKSTAAVGAMLCLLCANHSISNFHFVSSALKPYSTIKHIGVLDQENAISDADVLYRDIETEDNKIKLPQDAQEETPQLEMRGFMRLGFRQLAAARWAASPLYTLDFSGRGKERFARVTRENGGPLPLKVRFKVVEPKGQSRGCDLISDRLIVEAVEVPGSSVSFSKSDLVLALNTMLDADGLGDSKYWLDSGSVKRS